MQPNTAIFEERPGRHGGSCEHFIWQQEQRADATRYRVKWSVPTGGWERAQWWHTDKKSTYTHKKGKIGLSRKCSVGQCDLVHDQIKVKIERSSSKGVIHRYKQLLWMCSSPSMGHTWWWWRTRVQKGKNTKVIRRGRLISSDCYKQVKNINRWSGPSISTQKKNICDFVEACHLIFKQPRALRCSSNQYHNFRHLQHKNAKKKHLLSTVRHKQVLSASIINT